MTASSAGGPLAARRARNARLQAQAEQLAEPHQREGKRLPVVMLPINTRSIVVLPAEARERFLMHLRLQITRAFSVPAADASVAITAATLSAGHDAGDIEGPDADSDATIHGPLLGAGCAICRGECCTAGGTHAFLKAASLVRVRAQLVAQGEAPTPASIEAHYMSALPVHHYHGSCVFHAEDGCTLARVLRSNLCNRYLCGGLTQLTRSMTGHEVERAFVAAADSMQLRRLARVDRSGTQSLVIPLA